MSALHVLADPVRLSIVRHLSEHGRATLPHLAEAVGVALNTARAHVQALEEARIVERAQQHLGGPGRPAHVYRLVADWVVATSDFMGLAQLLATVVLRSGSDRNLVHTAGHDWGRWWLGRPGVRRVEQELPHALERLGFDAQVNGDLVLSGCPCPLVAPDDPLLVCELTAGVVDGMLAGSASSVRMGRRHNDPARRHCRIELHRP
ncbi:MAG: helix-turn-helix domain-containing protein, partial [Actinomycetota bacterium]|nr:helix-turn-helix domain-containing protein [Actinomycetota bacterium]